MKSTLIFSFLLCALSADLMADQRDARLDDLFGSLKSTAVQSEGDNITAQIWNIWLETQASDSQELMQQGLEAMARRDLKASLEIYDELTEKEPEFAEAFNKRATVHYMLGNIKESASDVKKTLELEPRHFGALAGLGLLYMAAGKSQAALVAFEEALLWNPHLSGPKSNIDALKKQIEKQKGDTL